MSNGAVGYSEREEAMFAELAAQEGAFFRSALMSQEEKLDILRYNFTHKPGAFLARFSPFMDIRHLDNFSEASSEYELAKYVREIARGLGRASLASPPTSPTSPTSPISPGSDSGTLGRRRGPQLSQKVKNRRYNAIRRLIQEGEYFSDAEMKERAPQLYDQMIDRYLSEDERQQEFRTGRCSGETPLSSMLSTLADGADSAQREKAEEGATEEGGPEEAPVDGDAEDPRLLISPQEKERLRVEFTSLMHERFLAGKDLEHFEYSTVDDNSDFDPLDLLQRDAEDKYFDDEEPN